MKCNIPIMNQAQKMAAIQQFSSNKISLKKTGPKKESPMKRYHLPLITHHEGPAKTENTESSVCK